MSLLTEVLADSPAFVWKLDDPSGTSAADGSPHARNGTYAGTPALAAAAVVPRHLAWDPDGVDDQVSLAYDAALAPGTGDFVIEFWIKGVFANGSSVYESLFNRDVGDTGNGLIVYTEAPNTGTAGALRIWCGGQVTQGTLRINDGNLHHVWIERRSGVMNVYVDNVLDVSNTRANNANGTGSPVLYHGRGDGGGNRLNTPVGYLAYYVGTIPSATRRGVHYLTGLNEDPPITPQRTVAGGAAWGTRAWGGGTPLLEGAAGGGGPATEPPHGGSTLVAFRR